MVELGSSTHGEATSFGRILRIHRGLIFQIDLNRLKLTRMRRRETALQPSMVMMGMRMLRLPNIENPEPYRPRNGGEI